MIARLFFMLDWVTRVCLPALVTGHRAYPRAARFALRAQPSELTFPRCQERRGRELLGFGGVAKSQAAAPRPE